MPIYEYRCHSCHLVSSLFFKMAAAAASDARCAHCGDAGVERIMSAFSRGRTDGDQLRDLDPRYYKMVDNALGQAPAASHPDHYLRQMAPFSAAAKSGEPYFKE